MILNYSERKGFVPVNVKEQVNGYQIEVEPRDLKN